MDVRRMFGAGKRSRTVDLNLGKVALYQLSYSRKTRQVPNLKKLWSGKTVSNRRPQPWQGCALPTELFPQNPASAEFKKTVERENGLEPSTSTLARLRSTN